MSKPPPTKIFICYKKQLEWTQGDKTVVQQNTYAETIAEILNASDDNFVAWFDDAGLPGGIAWEQTIYSNLLDSDVVLVVIGRGTAQSEWVKREIALAKALEISVYPLGVGIPMDQAAAEQNVLGVGHLQGKVSQNVKLAARAALLAELSGPLKAAARRTAEAQRPVLSKLLSRHDGPKPQKAPDKQRAASFELTHAGGTSVLHVASGDISQVRGIDVLVSSENDYLQMARFFESRTISSTLRLRGAQVQGGRFHDTIQKEIDTQLEGRFRPLGAGECVVTSAGGPGSALVKFNGAKYIVHVVAVQSVIANATVAPFSHPDQIVDCVRSVLVKVCEINEASGVVSPPGSEARSLQERRRRDGYIPVRSVIFPLFGTGRGGAEKADVIELMLNGLEDFLNRRTFQGELKGLTDIYLSAYLTSDVEQVSNALAKRFPRHR